ncbi:DUF6712 family protein [Bizionia sp.]|uniref:DUF6712 family protein n=1 Tax=Bizionia sp. TaxID=1954480 RepID=UPI003A94E0EE
MKLLFDYDTNNGDLEIHELIGHIDKDIDFKKLKSDIISATKELIRVIGQPVYDSVVTIYEAGSLTDDQNDLLYNTRYPIALDAIRHHIKSSDVTHGNNGRKMRVDDHEKQAFEWMLDRDNENLERKYYKAFDELIQYLDETNTLWKSSTAFQESQKYFVRTTADFDPYYPINSRLLLLKLQPAFRQCEKRQIMPRLPEGEFNAIKDKLKAATPLDADESLLVDLIKEACVFHALAWGMRVLRVTLFPEGVLQNFTSDRTTTKGRLPSVKLETELAAQEFASRSKEVLKELETMVTDQNGENTAEDIDCMSNPKYTFDDDDSFVSL